MKELIRTMIRDHEYSENCIEKCASLQPSCSLSVLTASPKAANSQVVMEIARVSENKERFAV